MDFRKAISRLVPTRFSAWLWMVLLVASWLSVGDIFDFYNGIILSTVGLGGFVIFKATLGTWCYDIVYRNKVLRLLVSVLLAICILLSAINGLSWYLYGISISRKLVTIVAETNVGETKEFAQGFLRNFVSAFFPIPFVITLFAIGFVHFILKKIHAKQIWLILMAISLPGIAYSAYFFTTSYWGKSNHISIVRTIVCARSVQRDMAVLKEWREMPRVLPQPDSLATTHRARKLVLVIGESASRSHLSLYGYPLPTTPRLDTLSQGLYRFDDALAPSTATAEVLPRLLTMQTDRPDSGKWCDYPAVMQLLREAGYRTAWLSNQERTGKNTNLSTLLAADADVVKYLGRTDPDDHLYECYDEVVLPLFGELYSGRDTLRFICIHLLGSHIQFPKRYPRSQAHITGEMVAKALPRPWLDDARAAEIAHYDNSIRYTDSILDCIIARLRTDTVPAVMVYVSDHGQNVYDNNAFNNRDTTSAAVPFLIFANEAYRRKNADVIQEIEQALDRPFSTSLLPEILMHLSGTTYPALIPENNPLSPLFEEKSRYVDGKKYPPNTSGPEGK